MIRTIRYPPVLVTRREEHHNEQTLATKTTQREYIFDIGLLNPIITLLSRFALNNSFDLMQIDYGHYGTFRWLLSNTPIYDIPDISMSGITKKKWGVMLFVGVFKGTTVKCIAHTLWNETDDLIAPGLSLLNDELKSLNGVSECNVLGHRCFECPNIWSARIFSDFIIKQLDCE